ncbi:helicase-associated domain-containing protein [Streptomyces sp. ISL-10]|uniref:helicase-associated domain-containing protein n=1 Tax=Streptomyces sp. ISL-10 TaxID=2819172 RepID=UPI001BE4E88E|nr:helicase-associated domain-containing protein [Streptomyces sp. ISL-10]MBT2369368.1 helicase-associated domain-containing protein [Streptomyces sp. ISL-10]
MIPATSDEIIHALQDMAEDPKLPERLTVLVQHAADAHGRLRLTTPASVLHTADATLIGEIAASPQLVSLRLRMLAPTVLTSPFPSDAVITALRDAGYAPVHEQDDGAIRLQRPTDRRHPLLPAPRSAEPAADVPDVDHVAEALLSAPVDKAVTRLSSTERVLARDTRQLDSPMRPPRR